jgi:superfamily II DNA/RNA helicase
MSLDNCKFVAIDEVDDVYQHDQDSLAKVLQIITKSKRPNLITCSATMDKNFITFYKENAGDYITNKKM